MNDTLEQYFSEKVLTPLRDRDKEANANKDFHLGEKSFEYVVTLTGDEPVVNYPTE